MLSVCNKILSAINGRLNETQSDQECFGENADGRRVTSGWDGEPSKIGGSYFVCLGAVEERQNGWNIKPRQRFLKALCRRCNVLENVNIHITDVAAFLFDRYRCMLVFMFAAIIRRIPGNFCRTRFQAIHFRQRNS